MHLRVTLAAAATVAIVASPAAAKQRPITGTLSKGGYTIIASDDHGRVVQSASKKFKLTPPAARVTLQLVDSKGTYAGPVVAPGPKRSVVIVGFRAGAQLGKVTVKKGYAVTRKLGKSSIDTKRVATAKSGRPISAGNLGLVKTPAGGGPDADRDGVPNTFDVDDDGDLILDNVDRSPVRAAFNYTDPLKATWMINIGMEQARIAAHTGLLPGADGWALNWNVQTYNGGGDRTLFDNIVAFGMKVRGVLLVPLPDQPAEFECGFVCNVGATTDMTQTKRFPQQFDPDADGLGSMFPVGAFNPANDGIATIQDVDPAKVFGLRPGANQYQIRNGTVFIEHLPNDFTRAVVLNFVFNTVPALSRWGDDTSSNGPEPVGYPQPDGQPGSQTNPAVLHRSPTDGDYWLEIGVWKPQRQASDGSWIDMGHLTYSVAGRTIGGGSKLWHCPSGAYAKQRFYNPNGYLTSDGWYDNSDDAPAALNDEVVFRVNLSACQRASGIPVWNDGDETSSEVTVAARTDYGDAAEGVGWAFRPAPTQQGGSGGSGGSGGGGGPPPPPATGTWNFSTPGTPSQNIAYKVHMNDAGITRFRIQFHEATPIKVHGDPSGWTCTTVTVGQPSDTLECTHPTGEAAGTDVSGTVGLQNSGSNGMPVSLTVTENGTDTALTMTQG